MGTVEVQGEFNAQRFFDTLARILSEREKVDITVEVTQLQPQEEAGVEQRKDAV